MNVIIAEPKRGKVYSQYLDRDRIELRDLLGDYFHNEATAELENMKIALLANSNAMMEGESANENLYPFFFLGIVVFCGVADDGEYIGLSVEQYGYVFDWLEILMVE